MLVYAGIDEAGYGPMLGPLCVGCAAIGFRDLEHADTAPNLWRLLQPAVCRRPGDRRRRIAIEDSKRLKGPAGAARHPLRHLERGVMAFCGTRRELPATDAELYDRLKTDVPADPWYATVTPLPLAHTTQELLVAAAMLARALGRVGGSVEMLRCEAVAPVEFNRQVRAMGSKAAVNLCAVMRRLDELWRCFPDAHPHVVVDRLGGRTRYLRALQLCFPGTRLRIVEESAESSRYALQRNGSTLTVSFAAAAESRHLPVALASMVAKYVRDLFMMRLNRFFQEHVPALRATAGYFGDARRYVRQIDGVMTRLGMPAARLVRSV